MSGPRSLELFCRVVDNFGDIGVCWRLARQLAGEHGIAVRLWVDDLASFRRICDEIDPAAEEQLRQGVAVRRWHEAMALPAPADIGDAVVEAFGCMLPPAFEQAMASRPSPHASDARRRPAATALRQMGRLRRRCAGSLPGRPPTA